MGPGTTSLSNRRYRSSIILLRPAEVQCDDDGGNGAIQCRGRGGVGHPRPPSAAPFWDAASAMNWRLYLNPAAPRFEIHVQSRMAEVARKRTDPPTAICGGAARPHTHSAGMWEVWREKGEAHFSLLSPRRGRLARLFRRGAPQFGILRWNGRMDTQFPAHYNETPKW